MPTPIPYAESAGALIRDIRLLAKLSQVRLVAACEVHAPRLPGIDTASIAHWERNRRAPNIAQLHTILAVCNASDEQLVDLVQRLSPRKYIYETMFLRWQLAGYTPAQCRENWDLVAPLVPTHPSRRKR